MHPLLALRDGLAVGQEGLEVLLDGVPNVLRGLLHGPPIAEAAGQTWAVGRVALVFNFLLDHELKRVVLHAQMIPRTSVHEKPLQASGVRYPPYVSYDPELSAKLLFGYGLSDLGVVHRLSTPLEHLDTRIAPIETIYANAPTERAFAHCSMFDFVGRR